MRFIFVASVATLLFATLPVVAAPASWFQWKSTLDGKIVCMQVSPGAGWVKASGPYDDSRCQPHASASSGPRRL